LENIMSKPPSNPQTNLQRWLLEHTNVGVKAVAVLVATLALLAALPVAAQVSAPTKPQGALVPKPSEASPALVKPEPWRLDTVEPTATTFAPLVGDVESLEVSRYMGKWYQIALIPNRFQKQCVSHTEANYRLLPTGDVQVTNRCRNASGVMEEAVGEARPHKAGDATVAARVVGGVLSPARLQVRFAPSWLGWLPWVGDKIWGSYWVIQLASDYRYVVVADPSREFLWVLARETKLSPQDRTNIELRLRAQGFEPGKLVFERH
jgi:apolipoprotein D and lipocalin family protein